MDTGRGLAIALAIFATSFALHIVAGATDQRWLFAVAVGLIYGSAAGFPSIATWFAGRATVSLLATASLAGLLTTSAALWAANGRSFGWWEVPLAAAAVAAVNGFVFGAARRRPGRFTRLALTAGNGPRAR